MLGNMSGWNWVSGWHTEKARFSCPIRKTGITVVMKTVITVPFPILTGSDFDIAGLCSGDGRHLVMMPHLERALLPWQCGYYPAEKRKDDVTPWMTAFVNARKWIEKKL
jgi:phosphoribosylformylglycinamidine synthase